MIVETRPASPEEVDAYHRWYDDVHIPELLEVEGFTAARRVRAEDGGTYLAVYDVDDIDAAKAALSDAHAAGRMTRPSGVQLDPPPSVRWFSDL